MSATESPETTLAILDDVLDERMRQIELGYTVDHDRNEHTSDELIEAALHYASFGNDLSYPCPWPTSGGGADTLRSMLIKAAALIVAAIELGDHEYAAFIAAAAGGAE